MVTGKLSLTAVISISFWNRIDSCSRFRLIYVSLILNGGSTDPESLTFWDDIVFPTYFPLGRRIECGLELKGTDSRRNATYRKQEGPRGENERVNCYVELVSHSAVLVYPSPLLAGLVAFKR